MTVPIERFNSIKYTRDFLRDLLDSKKTKKIPREIRRRASSCLRHFPSDLDMMMAAEDFKKTFGVSKSMKGQVKDWLDDESGNQKEYYNRYGYPEDGE